MKSIVFFHLLLLLLGCTRHQESDSNPVQELVSDLKGNSLSDEDIMKKFLVFASPSSMNMDIEKIVNLQIPIYRKQVKECEDVKILRHNIESEIVRSYNLHLDKMYSPDEVFYVACDSAVVFPVLVRNGKIITITSIQQGSEAPFHFVEYQ